MTAFTPGPYEPHGVAVLANHRGLAKLVVARTDTQPRPVEECEANARFFAAAPDLLAALEKIANSDDDGSLESEAASMWQYCCETARAAIARAKREDMSAESTPSEGAIALAEWLEAYRGDPSVAEICAAVDREAVAPAVRELVKHALNIIEAIDENADEYALILCRGRLADEAARYRHLLDQPEEKP